MTEKRNAARRTVTGADLNRPSGTGTQEKIMKTKEEMKAARQLARENWSTSVFRITDELLHKFDMLSRQHWSANQVKDVTLTITTFVHGLYDLQEAQAEMDRFVELLGDPTNSKEVAV